MLEATWLKSEHQDQQPALLLALQVGAGVGFKALLAHVAVPKAAL